MHMSKAALQPIIHLLPFVQVQDDRLLFEYTVPKKT